IFFFQAEDGIRYPLVTGVQTCALPISSPRWWAVQDLNLPPRRSPRPPSAYSSRATAQHTWGSVQVQAFQLEWQRSRMLHEHFERSEEHTSELQSRVDLVCRLLLEKKQK